MIYLLLAFSWIFKKFGNLVNKGKEMSSKVIQQMGLDFRIF